MNKKNLRKIPALLNAVTLMCSAIMRWSTQINYLLTKRQLSISAFVCVHLNPLTTADH